MGDGSVRFLKESISTWAVDSSGDPVGVTYGTYGEYRMGRRCRRSSRPSRPRRAGK
ncbi:MAG: hypothetical protein U0800_11965 [Isosphaeraceae bacterium]